jgi:hypothetical protein
MQRGSLCDYQREIVERPLNTHMFLEGPAGTGKTTAGAERLLLLLEKNICADSILVLVPLRTLAEPYYHLLRTPDLPSGSTVSVMTLNGLARRMISLFWPLVAGPARFAHPDERPVFLTLETAQYYMARVVKPALDEGFFDSIRISRNRLYSQIIDNLNKAAVVGFPYHEIGARLKAAWAGDSAQAHVYNDAQTCASRFREHCLANNLLDFSLQIEIFRDHLWSLPLCREHLTRTYRHLIVDNLEEDTPVAHDLLREWLPEFDSALLIYDQYAGYRSFLGASPKSAYALKDLCSEQVAFHDSFIVPPALEEFGSQVARVLGRPHAERLRPNKAQGGTDGSSLASVLTTATPRFVPQMLDWVSEQVVHLVCEAGVPPGEIAILAPYLSDSLKFALTSRLDLHGIPVRSRRPSRSLQAEPAAQCLLTLSVLAHPQWELRLTPLDVVQMVLHTIEGMDLVRAHLLAQCLYDPKERKAQLIPADQIDAEDRNRITYQSIGQYEWLRGWLEQYRAGSEDAYDVFLSCLFGEVLSQPGFCFHANYALGEIAANLIESVQKFRWAAGQELIREGQPLGKAYVEMVREGVFAAQYMRSWQDEHPQAVLLAPAHTFLMSNRVVDYQFWLDVGSRGWHERLYQPLTHPYVLSRDWPVNQAWQDPDEQEATQEHLFQLIWGLTRRCRRGIYLGMNQLSEEGWENQGKLLVAINRIAREFARESSSQS